MEFSLSQWVFILTDQTSLALDFLEEAIASKNPHVRSLAALHSSMTLTLIQPLLSDEDWYVRRTALSSPCLRLADLEDLMFTHQHLDVRERALELFISSI